MLKRTAECWIASRVLVIQLVGTIAIAETPVAVQSAVELVDGPCVTLAQRPCDHFTVWPAAERQAVTAILRDIESRPGGRHLIASSGIRTIVRKTRGEVPSYGALATTGTARDTITIFDHFFAHAGMRDRFSGTPGYSLQTRILTHEFFHGIDTRRRRLSEDPSFRLLVGFSADGQGPMSLALGKAGARVNELNEAGQYEVAWELNRRTALSGPAPLPSPLPSLNAIVTPAEAFAEIGAHLFLAPLETRRIVAPAITRYFNERVFRPM